MGYNFVLRKQRYNPLKFIIMKKIMFLALMLSVMAVASASANDSARRPSGAMFGIGNGGAFVAINVGDPSGPGHHHHGEYRGGAPGHCDGRYHRGNCPSCNKHAKKIENCKKCKPHKRCDYHKRDHNGRPHPGYHKPHRPGTPPPPPPAPRRW